MRTIFSNTDLVHTFAQRTQQEGRTSSGGMFFNGNSIYSYGYHYLLGEFINETTILINDTGYSSSTSKHIHLLINATRQYRQLYFKDICLDNVYNRIINASKSIINARKKEIYANEIIKAFESLESFLNEFGQAIVCGYYGYKLTDKNLIIKDEKFKEIKKIYKSIAKDKDKFIELGKERERKTKEREKRIFEESLTKFFNYELNYITKKTNEDFLRVSQDKKKIETTQGVKIDIQEAKNLYSLIEKGIDIKGIRIDNFTVISLNGHLKVGCHNINVKNMHEVGNIIKNL